MAVKKLLRKPLLRPASLQQRMYLFDLRTKLGVSVVGIRNMSSEECSREIDSRVKQLRAFGPPAQAGLVLSVGGGSEDVYLHIQRRKDVG